MTPTMTMTEVAHILGVAHHTVYRLKEQRRFDPFPECLLKPFGDFSAEERLGRLGVQFENVEMLRLELDKRRRAASRDPDDFPEWPGLAHPKWAEPPAEARRPRSLKAAKRTGRKKRGARPVPVIVAVVFIPVLANQTWNADADSSGGGSFVHLV